MYSLTIECVLLLQVEVDTTDKVNYTMCSAVIMCSHHRMCSLTIECVLLLYAKEKVNYTMCSVVIM